MRTQINKLYIIALLAIFGINGAMAQDLYRAGQTIKGNGFTYVVEEPWAEDGITVVAFPDDVRLRNINNKFTGARQKAGNVLVPIINAPKSYNSDGDAFKKFHNIINSVLSNIDKQNAKGSTLFIDVHINSQTGKIDDVEFRFNINDGFAKIAPEKYYQIETQLKQQVTYSINSVGRAYNYNYDFWEYLGVWFGKTIY